MSGFNPKPKPEPRPKKEKKRIRRVSPKQARNIRENKKYYARQRERKGFFCEECRLNGVTRHGRNVSHILGKGSNPALYLLDENNKILCDPHEDQWTNGSNGGKTKMLIYAETREIKDELLNEHYTGDTPA